MVDSLIEQKRAQRKTLLRALYGLVEGREGFAITPMQYFALGTQVGLQQDVIGQTVRFLASEGLLEYKPASEAVALTHNGVVEVEHQSNEPLAESRKAQLGALPQRILSVLRHKRAKIQMEELKENLPEFSDVPDSDWYATINDLQSDGMIDARVARSGIYDAVSAANNLAITQRGRALTPDSSIESKQPRNASSETDDRRFARLAIDEARKSVAEDERVHPRVGVVVVKDGHVLATAHRGEFPQCHGEFIALEKKLADVSLAGSTVYTTLEPCTSRNHPKVPCAIRLGERKVARVVIGMLDPDDRISGRGQRALRKAGIATELFDHDLMTEIEELNRDFIREKEANADQTKPALTQADRNAAKVRKYIRARAQVSENGNNWGAMGAEIVEVNDDNVVTLFVASSMQSTTAFAVYVHCDDLQILEVPMGSCSVRIRVLKRYGETVQLGEIKRWEDRNNPTPAQSAVEKGPIAYHARYVKVGTAETRELRVYSAKDGSNYFVLESKPDGTFYGNNADISKRFMALQVEYEALGFARQQSGTGASPHRLFIK